LIFGSSLRPEDLARDLDVVVLYQSFASLQEFLARLDVDDRGATIDLTLLTPEEAVSSDFLIRSGAVEFDRWENF